MRRLFICTALFPLFAACNTTGNSELNADRSRRGTNNSTSSTDASAMVNGMNDTAFRLYGTMTTDKEYASKNLFISPTSVSVALGMTYLGARTTTENEMAKALAIPGTNDAVGPMYQSVLAGLKGKKDQDGYELAVANKIWTQEGFGFKSEFKDATKKFFNSEVGERNFKDKADRSKAIAEINKWALDNTNKKIDSIVNEDSIKPETRIVLANAVYFLGDWLSPFPGQDPRFKQDMTFTKLDKKKIDVPQMFDKKYLKYGEAAKAQIIEMPYKGKNEGQASDYSMVVVLPNEGSSLVALEKSLNAQAWDKMVNGMKQEEVYVTMPKWEVKSDAMKLKAPLERLGMKSAFIDGQADFSGMTGQKNILISEVLHKTFVRVDEKGTEAAAVTAVIGAEATSAPINQPKNFRADRPFLYAIRNMKTGMILFVGRMVDPSGK
jgi:serpin B